MMKFHPSSFLMGFACASVIAATGKRLKPVAVELGALGLHLGHLGWGVVERQREHIEDLWAEIEEKRRERWRGSRKTPPNQTNQTVRHEVAGPSNGAERPMPR